MKDEALESLPAEAEPQTLTSGMIAVRAAFYAFIAWIPIETLVVFDTNKDNPSDGGVTVSKILGFLLFGLALVEWRNCFRKIPVAFWMIVWYAGVLSVTELWIPRTLGVKFRSSELTLVQMVGLFVISANLFENPHFRGAVLRFYGWWSALVAATMILGLLGHQFADIQGRYTLLGEDPNFTAGLLALGAICVAGNKRLREAKGFIFRLGVSLIALGVLIAAILQTGSRGGLLAFAAGVIALALCGGKAARRKRLVVAGCLALLLSGMVAEEFARGSTTAARLQRSWEEGDTAGRTEIWDISWKMFSERPLMGFGGINNFYTLGSRLNVPVSDVYFRDTHNLLLAVLTEVGLVGGVPFIAAMFYVLWIAWRYGGRYDDGLPFALMSVLFVMNASITGYHQKIFWVVAGAAAACGLERKEAPESTLALAIAEAVE